MRGVLFPALQEQLGALTAKHRQLIANSFGNGSPHPNMEAGSIGLRLRLASSVVSALEDEGLTISPPYAAKSKAWNRRTKRHKITIWQKFTRKIALPTLSQSHEWPHDGQALPPSIEREPPCWKCVPACDLVLDDHVGSGVGGLIGEADSLPPMVSTD